MPHACACAARARVGKKWHFYERKYDPTWFEHQYGRRRERAKDVHRGAAGWLCPLPVSGSISLGYPACGGSER